MLLHSSGTTRQPKGIPLRHRNVFAGVTQRAAAGALPIGDEEYYAYLPMAWVGDFVVHGRRRASLLRFTINIPERQETVLHDLREVAPTVLSGRAARLGRHADARAGAAWRTRRACKRRLYDYFMPRAIEIERKRLAGTRADARRAAAAARSANGSSIGPIKDQLGLSRMPPRLHGRRGHRRGHLPVLPRARRAT